MRRLNLMILIIGVAIIFFGCSKNNPMAPDLSQGDDLTSSLKAHEITEFTGICTPLPPNDDDANAWYDDAGDEERVTGVSIWLSDPMIPIDETTFKVGGTGELFVGAEVYADVGDGNYDGKWETKWWGIMTETGIVAYAVGYGTEGDVKGMFAEWTYTMNFGDGIFYTTEGSIAPKQMTKTIKFFEATGPIEFDYESGQCGEFPYETVTGEGNASHIGHYTVLNTGCFDGVSLISGIITAANGDEIHTYIASAIQVAGIWYFRYIVNGGTGRFDDVSGYIDMYGTIEFTSPFAGVWTLEGEGVIVY